MHIHVQESVIRAYSSNVDYLDWNWLTRLQSPTLSRLMETCHPTDAKRAKPMKFLNSGYDMGLLRVPSHVADYWRSEVPQSVVGILEADSTGKERLMIPNIESYETGNSSGQQQHHPDSIGTALRPSLLGEESQTPTIVIFVCVNFIILCKSCLSLY